MGKGFPCPDTQSGSCGLRQRGAKMSRLVFEVVLVLYTKGVAVGWKRYDGVGGGRGFRG